MITIPKQAIDRRTILRGLGTALALPFLDAMQPLMSAAGGPTSPRRLGVVYVPNGMVMEEWTPTATGALGDLPAILQPLSPVKNHISVLTGLSSKEGFAGSHSHAAPMFMTGLPPKSTRGAAVEAGRSMDQYAALTLGGETALGSLELSLESSEQAGTCADNLSCAYSNTIAWRSPATPLPTENNPRAVFERLFGDADTTSRDAQLLRMAQRRSLLDSVTQKLKGLDRQLGAADQRRLEEFTESVRDVERRLQRAESDSTTAVDGPSLLRPAGIPATFVEHATLMYDLQVLAFQADLTRVTTFMVGHELSGQTYPHLGVPDPHHPISHHQDDPEKIAKLVKVNTHHIELFSAFVKKLSETSDAHGTLLDSSVLLYGAGISNSMLHSPDNLPILLAGSAGGRIRGGMHHRYAPTTPLVNLHLTLLDKLGAPIDRMGLSTGQLSDLSV
jgi:hypothetical protein